MDSFSGADSLRALCAPLCCCFSQRLALSPSNESLNQLASNEQADAEGYAGAHAGQRDELAAYGAPVGHPAGPAWGQQGSMQLSRPTTPRSRQRRRGGDISGGGTDTGSGLTRWTLFRSWLRGGPGAIQLPDSDDDRAENATNSRSSSSNRLLGRVYGDEDAAPIALDDVSLPPAPPSVYAATTPSRSSGPPSSSDRTTSDGRSSALGAEEAAEREARRQRRRIRRQARELGLSPQEYIERINTGLLSVETGDAPTAADSGRSAQEDPTQTRSQASSESHGSRRSRRARAAAAEAGVSAANDSPLEAATASSTSSRRRGHHGSQLSVSSHSTTVSSSSSSKRSDQHRQRRHRRHAEDAEDGGTPLARSPLEGPDSQFFEDEHGQLHAVERGDDDGNGQGVGPQEGTPLSYDHIGVLPGPPSPAVADETR
ncbi:hypothetical protein JCM3774_000899 [Rhodotorula dairenensis]